MVRIDLVSNLSYAVALKPIERGKKMWANEKKSDDDGKSWPNECLLFKLISWFEWQLCKHHLTSFFTCRSAHSIRWGASSWLTLEIIWILFQANDRKCYTTQNI